MNQLFGFVLGGIGVGMVYASLALALVLIWRATGIVNFAQGGMAMFTTFLADSVIRASGSYWLGFFVALLAGLALGAAVERLLIRPVEGAPPLNAVIITLGVLALLEGLAGLLYGGRFRPFPTAFSDVGFGSGSGRIAFSPFDAFVSVAVLGVAAALAALFRFTDLGLYLRASAFAPGTARMLGIPVGRMLTLGWAVAAVAGSLAGLCTAPTRLLHPTYMDSVLVFAFVAAILGGLDSLLGAIVGGLSLGVVLSVAGGYLGSGLVPMLGLLILMAVLTIRPEGLFSGPGPRRV